MGTQAGGAALGVQLPEVEVAVILTGKANAGSRMLDAHLGFHDVVLDFLFHLAALEVGCLNPYSRREGILRRGHEASIEICHLGRCGLVPLIVPDGDVPVVARGGTQRHAAVLYAHGSGRLFLARIPHHSGALGIGGEQETIGCLDDAALVGLELPGEERSGLVHALRVR